MNWLLFFYPTRLISTLWKKLGARNQTSIITFHPSRIIVHRPSSIVHRPPYLVALGIVAIPGAVKLGSKVKTSVTPLYWMTE